MTKMRNFDFENGSTVFTRIFARFCKFQKLSQKETAKESAKRREPTLTKVTLF
jgi:hypothetical protein